MRAPLTVIILTLQEEENIRPCLESLDWADDVVLVDSGSTDRTVARARESRADVRVFEHRFEDFAAQRNWALERTCPRHRWILFMDADERATPAFADAIRRTIAAPGDRVGYFLCYRNYFLGRWIRHVTLFPSWQLRLLEGGKVRYEKAGHGQREVSTGPLGYVEEPYEHYGFSKGIADWLARHNRYSTDEVDLIRSLRAEALRPGDLAFRGAIARRRALKRIAARMGFRPLFRFVYLYFLRGGFLDGRPGLIFTLLRVAHEIHITAKLAETSNSPGDRA